MNFCERLEQSEFFRALDGVKESVIEKAEEELSINFASEYREYLLKYGVASIKGHEFLGLGSSARLDVVYNTLQLRKENILPAEGYYVVEDIGMDGIVIAQDHSGTVYEISDAGRGVKKYESLTDYVAESTV